MTNMAYLKNPLVNSGSEVYLNGASINYNFRPLVRVTPLTNSYSLSEAQTAGFENPSIQIKGYIDTNNLSTSTIQHSSLLALSKVQYDGTANTATTFYVGTGSNNSPLYATNATSSTIRVVIENFSCIIDTNDSDEGHVWLYTINMRETS